MATMAAENFRAQYYDKVGFRGNKSLEILLSEKPIDLKKLSNLCRKFCLPAVHRFTVWKVLLGVLPTFEENASVFEKDQTDQCNALKRSLLVMRVVNDDTRPSEVVVLMYLLGEGQLRLDIEQQACGFFAPFGTISRRMQDEEAQHILGIASAFFKMGLAEQDVYWMTRNFWKQLKKLSIDSCLMSKQMEDTLEKEDAELFQHLLRIKAFPVLPVDVWFRRCFAEVLDEDALVRVWDKVIGGSVKFLPQVGAVLLMSLRTSLLHLRSVGDVLGLLSKVPKEASDVVVNKVLE
ncbi:unnamed protein product [Ixodes hexagonus]